MGHDKVRHLRLRKGRYFWVPSKTLEDLGYSCEALGADVAAATVRATQLNADADRDRAKGVITAAQELPATAIARLATDYDRKLEERLAKGKIAARTVKDYRKLMPAIVATFGKLPAESVDAETVETWLDTEPNQWAKYHLGLMMRTFLKFCGARLRWSTLPEFVVSTPAARKIKWSEADILAIVAELKAKGWRSLAVGFLVEWCIGQNPGDIWDLPRSSYASGCIDVTRAKTGVGGDPIPLWEDVHTELDAYLADSPAVAGAPLFRKDKGGGKGKAWLEITRQRRFARARDDLKLNPALQMRDLRRTAITETFNLGFKKEQARALSRHATTSGLDPYDAVHAGGIVVEIQRARGAARSFNKKGNNG